MRIPESIIEDIMRRTDLVEVAQSFFELKKAGDNDFKACCPFHHEKTPSFHINASKQVYHCFGCGVGGNVITLVKAMVNTDYVGAMQWLARRYNITIPVDYDDGVSADDARRRRQFHEDGLRLLDSAAGWFQSRLNAPEGAPARQYLASRGIDQATVERYRIGYAPDGWDAFGQWALANGFSKELLEATGLCNVKENGRLTDFFRNRLMFSICDELSRVLGFSGRVMGPTPPNTGKYVNTHETEFFHKSSILYGLNIARQAFRKAGWALVCEGQMDVIACHRAGLEQAVASQGTAFTEEHVRMLAKANVKCAHLAFDGDAAGHKATMKTVKLLYAGGIQPMITTLPDGDDPDGIFRTGGAEALQKVMSTAEPAVNFAFRVFSGMYPGGSPEERSLIVNSMLDIIGTIQDDVARMGYCQWLAGKLSLPENVLINLLENQRKLAAQAAQLEARRQYHADGAQSPEQSGGLRGETQLPPDLMPRLALEGSQALHGLVVATLDLTVHYHEAAKCFAAEDVMRGLQGDTPALQALNFVLAGTQEGEWAESIEAVAQGEWISDPVVSKVLTASAFGTAGDAAGEGPLPEMQALAVQDCLRRANELAMEAEQQQLRQKMAAAAGQRQTQSPEAADASDEVPEIDATELKAAIELARRKKALYRR